MSTLFKSGRFNGEPYMYFQRDGLLDIYIGLILILTAAMLWSDMPWLVGIYPALFLPAWQSAKRSIVAPRVKDLELNGLSTEQVAAKRAMLMGLAGLVLLLGVGMFWLLAANNLPAWLTDLTRLAVPVILGGVALLVLVFVGFINNARRFYLYAALAVLAVGVSLLLKLSILWILLAAGVAIFLSGVVMLVQFLREYPLPE